MIVRGPNSTAIMVWVLNASPYRVLRVLPTAARSNRVIVRALPESFYINGKVYSNEIVAVTRYGPATVQVPTAPSPNIEYMQLSQVALSTGSHQTSMAITLWHPRSISTQSYAVAVAPRVIGISNREVASSASDLVFGSPFLQSFRLWLWFMAVLLAAFFPSHHHAGNNHNHHNQKNKIFVLVALLIVVIFFGSGCLLTSCGELLFPMAPVPAISSHSASPERFEESTATDTVIWVPIANPHKISSSLVEFCDPKYTDTAMIVKPAFLSSRTVIVGFRSSTAIVCWVPPMAYSTTQLAMASRPLQLNFAWVWMLVGGICLLWQLTSLHCRKPDGNHDLGFPMDVDRQENLEAARAPPAVAPPAGVPPPDAPQEVNENFIVNDEEIDYSEYFEPAEPARQHSMQPAEPAAQRRKKLFRKCKKAAQPTPPTRIQPDRDAKKKARARAAQAKH